MRCGGRDDGWASAICRSFSVKTLVHLSCPFLDRPLPNDKAELTRQSLLHSTCLGHGSDLPCTRHARRV